MRLFRWLPLLACAGAAQAAVLDFGSNLVSPTICTADSAGLGALVPCTNATYLSQTYGDVAGVVDFSYAAPRQGGISLRWWDEYYNTLYGVVWADGNDADSLARIEIRAVQPDAVVSITGFDLGAYPLTNRITQLSIHALGGSTPLYSFAGVVGQTVHAPTHFNVSVAAAGGLVIEWRDSAYNVGLDNLQYSVSPVPELPPLASMLAGLAVLGVAAGRRRR